MDVAGERDRHWADGDPVPRSVHRAFDRVWDHLVVEDPPTPSDAIFCFGSRHWRVPERAAALFADGVAPVVLVTGGPEVSGDRPEADRLADDLEDAGVARDRIVVEGRARNTGENVALGMTALARHVEATQLTLVSWPLAARRCRATFAVRHPAVALASAPALPEPGVRWSPTPRRIRFALGEVDRLTRYGGLGMIAPEPLPSQVRRSAALLRHHLAGGSADDASLGQVEASRLGVEPQQSALLLREG